MQPMSQTHSVYLALGSNLESKIGSRASHIHAALQAIRRFGTVADTSFLYETAAAYVTDQPDFLNAVCQIYTSLAPHELLVALKGIEQELGRTFTVRYGPRTVDLDILFYDDIQMESEDLTIPHPRIVERDFVLEPLLDIAPDLVHPSRGQTIEHIWSILNPVPLQQVMPVGPQVWRRGEKTRIMGIINGTPDSFSGDGLLGNQTELIERAVAQARRFVDEGADCLDIGGQSTRPGHTLVSVAEEIDRVMPIIEAVHREVSIPISVDTFRAEVARVALQAGASIINDVWAMRFDPAIGQVAAEAGVPLILMHNQQIVQDSVYSGRVESTQPSLLDDIVENVQQHLGQRIKAAQIEGVPRWQLVIDPGIGFGKSIEEHLVLTDRLAELEEAGYPLLYGPSRKGFIGKLLGGLPPDNRVEGTIALCVLASERGAHILRVHDVQEMARAARIVDAVCGRKKLETDP